MRVEAPVAAASQIASRPAPAQLAGRASFVVGRRLPIAISRPCASSSRARVSTAAVAETASSLERPTEKTTFYFAIANSKWMLDELEELKELMEERARYFGEKNRERDFWLVQEPEFLDALPDVTAKVSRPCTAIVSTDKKWITFMKVRLDRIVLGSFEGPTDSLPVPLRQKSRVESFDPPPTWEAPYTKYPSGWWTQFEPKNSQ